MRISAIVLSILIMLFGCTKTGNTSKPIDENTNMKDYIFEFVKENKKDLTSMVKLLAEYDFATHFRYNEYGELSVTTVPESYQDEVLENRKLMNLIKRFIDEEFIDEIYGGFNDQTHAFFCAIYLYYGIHGDYLVHWLEYSDGEIASSDEEIIKNWYYMAMALN